MKRVIVLPSAGRCSLLSQQRRRRALAHGREPGLLDLRTGGSVSLLAGAAGDTLAARDGAAARETDLGQPHEDLPASARGRAGSDFAVTVLVYFHVVTDGAKGDLRDSQIADQIRVLNNTFAGGEGGFDTGFSFALAGVTRTNNPAWFYANPGGVNEHTMKQTLRQGGPDALNAYSTRAGAYLDCAYLPEIVTKPGQVHLDGVVIDWESLRRVSDAYEGRYNQGGTATHEVGHWLNLEHTFYDGRLRCRLVVHRNVARLEVGSGASSDPSRLADRRFCLGRLGAVGVPLNLWWSALAD